MKAAKHFRWEGAHRLPWHSRDCKNLHGHSYRMTVELEGPPGAHGMLIDFQDLKAALQPLVDAWDHATLVAADDAALLRAVDSLGSKRFVLPCDSTSENLCRYVFDYLCRHGSDVLIRHGIRVVRVRISETDTSYAEHEGQVAEAAPAGADGDARHAAWAGQPLPVAP